ncbi:MAG: hypothetical protein GC185_12480 [Alphaproteobacteria bacterium]|nr:hypothetical protein [Alphaproteobacteria bacterium]
MALPKFLKSIKVPAFFKRKGLYVILAIVAFLFYAHSKTFVNIDQDRLDELTGRAPRGPLIALNMQGVTPADPPAGMEEPVTDWVKNAVTVIMTFSSNDIQAHFNSVLPDYFTANGRAVYKRALQDSGVERYVISSCRSEGLQVSGSAQATSFGTRDDKNIWRVRVPVILTDVPLGGYCSTGRDAPADNLRGVITVLVQQSQKDTGDMKLDGWQMSPDQ